MTVKQLIDLLQALPQDLPVYLGDSEGCFPDTAIDQVDDREEGSTTLPRVVEAYVHPPMWNHPRRVLIG